MRVLSAPALWPAARGPVLAGSLAVGAGLTAALSSGLASLPSAATAGLLYLTGAVLVTGHGRGNRFGAANAVTLARFVGTCWVGALVVEAAFAGLTLGGRLLLIGLAVGCLVLDGVDGRVARARHEVSPFGARFDMETDTLLLLCLGSVIPILGVAGWWTLAVPGLRYSYLAVSWLVPALRVPLYDSVLRKVIAVLGTVSLLVALAVDLIHPGWPPSVAVLVGLALLSWSFGRDVGWQIRRHRVLSGSLTRERVSAPT